MTMDELSLSPDSPDSAVALQIALESMNREWETTKSPSLLRAMSTVKAIIDQRGCEHFDDCMEDGQLTTLIDVIMFG